MRLFRRVPRARRDRRRRSRKRSALRKRGTLLLAGCGASLLLALAAWELLFLQIRELDDRASVRRLEVPLPDGGSRLLVLGPTNPYWTPIGHVSKYVTLCVVKAEDDRFWNHTGFDWVELRSSFRKNLDAGGLLRGGSTITMQLAKNLFLWRSKSILRKGLEAYLAIRLEATLEKRRILELYLNVVEWGPGVYGIGEASRHYFDKAPSALTLGEAALLASILPNPIGWNPHAAPSIAHERRQQLLGRLKRENAL